MNRHARMLPCSAAPREQRGCFLYVLKLADLDRSFRERAVIASIRPDALEEAATTLAAGKSYGIYKVILTEENLRRMGLSA